MHSVAPYEIPTKCQGLCWVRGDKAVNKTGMVSALLAPQSSVRYKQKTKITMQYSLISVPRG